MMPTFVLLGAEETLKEPLLDNLTPSQLPKISVEDPAVLSIRQELDLTAGEVEGMVVKFLRRSLNAGVSPFYRVIVGAPVGKKRWSL